MRTEGNWMTEHPDMEALSAYLDGESDPLESRCIATHLAVCPSCATVVRDLQAISQGLRALVPEQPPVDLAARVGALLDSPRLTRQRPASWRKRRSEERRVGKECRSRSSPH